MSRFEVEEGSKGKCRTKPLFFSIRWGITLTSEKEPVRVDLVSDVVT